MNEHGDRLYWACAEDILDRTAAEAKMRALVPLIRSMNPSFLDPPHYSRMAFTCTPVVPKHE